MKALAVVAFCGLITASLANAPRKRCGKTEVWDPKNNECVTYIMRRCEVTPISEPLRHPIDKQPVPLRWIPKIPDTSEPKWDPRPRTDPVLERDSTVFDDSEEDDVPFLRVGVAEEPRKDPRTSEEPRREPRISETPRRIGKFHDKVGRPAFRIEGKGTDESLAKTPAVHRRCWEIESVDPLVLHEDYSPEEGKPIELVSIYKNRD